MYHIIGEDGKEYGPATVERLCQWTAEGRVNARTKMRPVGSPEWRAAGEFPELAAALQAAYGSPGSAKVRPPEIPRPPQQTLSVAALILGILTPLCFGPLTGIPGIITGHMALNRARKSPGTYGGAGAATAGLILSYVGLVVWLVIPLLLLPALGRAKARASQNAKEIKCVSNLKMVGLSFRIWALDNADQFPFAVSTNSGGTLEYVLPNNGGGDPNSYLHLQVMSNELSSTEVLICPADNKTAAVSFALLTPANVSYQVMSGTNVVDTNPTEVLARCPIHGSTALVDGSVLRRRDQGSYPGFTRE